MYEKLIEELRRPHADCDPWALMEQAADAIEELSKYANTIMQLKNEGWYLQQTKNHDGYVAVATMQFPEPPKEEG